MTSSCDKPPLRRTATRSSKVELALARIAGDLQNSVAEPVLCQFLAPLYGSLKVVVQVSRWCSSPGTVQGRTRMLPTGRSNTYLAMSPGRASAGKPTSLSSNSTRGFRVVSRPRLQSRAGIAMATCTSISTSFESVAMLQPGR